MASPSVKRRRRLKSQKTIPQIISNPIELEIIVDLEDIKKQEDNPIVEEKKEKEIKGQKTATKPTKRPAPQRVSKKTTKVSTRRTGQTRKTSK
jgi:hypothetical protein